MPNRLRGFRLQRHLRAWRPIQVVLALVLCAPVAFAQHGAGGGHAGGGHASGGGHSGAAAGVGSHATAGRGAAAIAGSHVWAGAAGSAGNSFVGRNTWQDPPGSHDRMTTAPLAGRMDAVRGPFAQTRPPIFVPRHFKNFNNFFFFSGGCFGGFFPGLCGSSFWPGYLWTPGYDYDPIYGCAGYGYLNDDPTISSNNFQAQPDTSAWGYDPSRDKITYSWQEPPVPGGEKNSSAPTQPVAIYLKDGSSYGVTDYWLSDGQLHYVTTYGGENVIPQDMLDLQKTVDENSAKGVRFSIRNRPSSQ